MTYYNISFFLYFLLFLRCAAQENLGYDRDALQRLTEYRQQHRKTINGELCAAAFVQDGQTYTDCTTAKAPDGSIGREWCYVEYQNSQNTGNYWNFCTGVINYDVVRYKAKEISYLKERDMQKAAIQIKNKAAALQEIIQKSSKICAPGHEAVLERIEKIKTSINAAEHTISKLEGVMSKINYFERTVDAVKQTIRKNRILVQQDKTNCEAIRGYEDDPEADGLRGSYYNNARFEGIPSIYKDDDVIDFIWDEISPAANVPIHHFSVRWDGYVMATETGEYIFSTLADCGVRVFLDDSAIIIDRMPIPLEGESLTENTINVLQPQKNTNVLKVYSEPQPLIGGQKYKIRIEYFHLSSLKWSNPLVARISLHWELKGMGEQVIPSKQLFKSNPKKSLKISGLPGNIFNLSFIEDGVLSFIDSRNHFITDVPLRYEGAKLIRTVSNPKYNKLQMSLSVPCTFYVAAPQSASNPIYSNDPAKKLVFTKGLDNITILRSENKSRKANDQTSLTIYGAKLDAGEIKLQVRPGTSYFMFLIPSKITNKKCDGEPIIVSRTDSETFDDCTASSYSGKPFSCKAGLSGINQDIMFGVWKTAGGYGIGQYLSVTFTKQIQLIKFQFKTRDDPQTWPRKVELHFSGKSDIEKINIIPGDHTYQLQIPRVTTSVKVIVTHMIDETHPSDTGGSMAFIGIPCQPIKEITSVNKMEKQTDSIAISFRSSSLGLPSGYKLDDGSPKAFHDDFFYGWEYHATPVNSAQCQDTALLGNFTHGGIQFMSPTEKADEDCQIKEKNCKTNTWSIDLPHYGYYKVTIEVGSPCGGEQVNSLFVNTLPFVTNEILRGGEYTKVIGKVMLITTATITLTSNSATTIQSIKIQKVND